MMDGLKFFPTLRMQLMTRLCLRMTMATTMTMALLANCVFLEVEARMVGWFISTPQSVTLFVQGTMRNWFPTLGVSLKRLMMACARPIAWGLYVTILVSFYCDIISLLDL